MTISANGDVTGVGKLGIYAVNSGTDLNVNTGAGTTVFGGITGIHALNYGTGALTVTANGDVTGTSNAGIYLRNYGTDLTVTTGVGTSVTGGNIGIFAINNGSGALTVTANGDVDGTNGYGIYAFTSGYGGLTVTTGTGSSSVTGNNTGIRAWNSTAAVTVTANGDVTGTNGTGIYARAAGPIDITVGPFAAVAGGTAGVQFVDGGTNTLRNFGTVSNLNGIGGTAILGGLGNERIDNFGTVTGNIDLGAGLNAFNNMQGGLFNSGTAVDLGGGNLLTNSGMLSPGGSGTVLTTALTGDLTQTNSGRFLVDLQGPNADRIDVIGSADLDGRVRPNFTLAGIGTSTQWTVLTTTGTLTDSGVSVVSTAAVRFDLIFPTATQMDLVLLGVDFAADGLNRNETSIGENFNKIYGAGGSAGLNPVLEALAQLPTVGSLANALDQLSPEIYLDTEIATLFSSLSFANSLMTCPVRIGPDAFIAEGQCVWAQISGRSFDQDRTFQTFGIDETSFQVAGGGQFALGDVWRIGGALGYEHSDLKTDPTNAKAEGDRFSGGVALKYNPGALLLAGGVSGTLGSYDTVRPIAFPGFQARAKGDNDIDAVNGRFRAAYQLGSGN